MDTMGLLTGIRCLTKLYEKSMKRVCAAFDLSLIQVKIVSFLHNNPELNTAKEIVEYRMLTKSNVSAAVDDLIRRGYMERKPDVIDRRRVYLYLLEKARPVTEFIDAVMEKLEESLVAGLDEKEIESYKRMKVRLTERAKQLLEGMNDKA